MKNQDKILEDQLPVVRYRIVGYLLLGLARIYSKKVEYLLYDFNDTLNEMKFFSEGRKKVYTNLGGMCLPESSSQRSKLASKLEVVDTSSSESSRRKNSNTVVEALDDAQFSSISLPENFDLDAFYMEPLDDDSSKIMLQLLLLLCIDPETSVEKFRHRFCLEDRLDPFELSDSDEELVFNSLSLIEQQPGWDNHTYSSEMISEGVKNQDKHPNEECTTTGQTVISEMTSVDNIMLKPSPNKSQLSVTIDVTPQSKAPVLSGKRKSELVAVRTPSSRELVRAPRKRKCVYDYPIVIPNELIHHGHTLISLWVYGTWVSSASDLVRKRRTCIAVLDRKEHRSFDYFSQPIIPSKISFFISYSVSEFTIVSFQLSNSSFNKFCFFSSKFDASYLVIFALHTVNAEAEVIAPLTPATQSTSFRFSEIHETYKVNQMGPTSSCESRENELFPIRDVDMDEIQREEGPSSLAEDNQENDPHVPFSDITSVPVPEKWSAVTKSVGVYLHSNFEQRKEKGEEQAVNLSQILKQKTKKESAKFFYQMLVLKTGGCIDVKQEEPYGEICVKQTPKLKEVLEVAAGSETTATERCCCTDNGKLRSFHLFAAFSLSDFLYVDKKMDFNFSLILH
ncbi:hypothetical protein L1987_43749 [Smallanthus sonchifolius]|uniref:Uncharacterized protein n=1 Tax=Smallanthus sonchifolius TaxID=185202 RepID=A0ACB9GNR3_9ASTR|nr:hypothetical protein L1987_43749 [Smallanthus sonchifolius]